MLRSPFPHARIRSIDAAKAAALPGVEMAVTGRDFPNVLVGVRMRDMPVLAVDKVRFAGEPVAAVAADSAEIAEAALDRAGRKANVWLALVEYVCPAAIRVTVPIGTEPTE